MVATVYMDDLWRWLRSDIKEHLDWDGIQTIFDYYEELEEDSGEPMHYDESLFYCWHKGEKCADILNDIDHIEFRDLIDDLREDLGQYPTDDEIEEACKERLEHSGTLLECSRGGYIYNDEF